MVQDPKSASPTPSQSTETPVNTDKEIKENMGAGKRHLLCSDYPEAVACFQEACTLLAQKYGQLSEECSDAYYYYGSSLLELARLENGVLGNALKGVPEEDEESDKDDEQFEKPNLAESDREKLREDVEAAMATEDDEEEGEEADKQEEGQKSEEEKTEDKGEKEIAPEGKAEEKQEKETAPDDGKPEEKEEKETAPDVGKTEEKEEKETAPDVGKTEEKEEKETAPDEGKTEEKEEKETAPEGKTEEKREKEKAPEEPEKEEEDKTETPSTSKPAEQSSSKSEQSKECEEEGDENPDDISNMQLAWEMLELARVLYKKKEKSKDNSLMVAQCHLKLGELGLEGEQYPQAITDFLECLVIQKEHLAETDRKLAETHYSLGLAYSFERRCDNALEHYQNALDVLEARVDLLEELIESKVGESDKEADDTMAECKEVGEIKDLIPDINSKIEDVLSVKKQNEGKIEGSPFTQTGETTTGFGTASSSSGTTCSTTGETTTGFGTASSSSSPVTTCSIIPVRKVAPSTVKECTSDISHLVRRKRPSPDEEDTAVETEGDSKKAKQEESDSNGRATTDKNGDHKNDDASRTSPEKTEAKEGDAAASPQKKMTSAGDVPVTMET